MKKLKIIGALILSIAMIMSCVACSSKKDNDEENEETTTTSDATVETEGTTESAAAAVEETEGTATEWICESCGATGNTGRFCNECGAMAPDSFLEDGYVDVAENTAPSATIMTYETEEFVEEGTNTVELTFGTVAPIPYMDPETGIKLDVCFHGTVTYVVDEGETIGSDLLKSYVLSLAQPRIANLVDLGVNYSDIESYTEDIELGLAYDLRENSPIHNVTVHIEEFGLTDSSQAEYDAAMGNN